MAGEIVHFEVPAQDAARATGFYRDLFGWSFQDMPGPVEYHLTQISDVLGAGIHPADQGGGIPGLFVYFGTDDIEQSIAQARALGGTAEDKQPVPGMGWFSRCVDTEGNHFGLFQADPSASAPASE
ncbi:MAG: VOC family protein [Dehalococcoidia bacterium]|nr:VOC family protein [Dehalococcoidia bacterium]